MTFVYLSPESELTTGNCEIRSKAKFIRKLDRVWMKSIVLPNRAVQAITRIVQLFVRGIFLTSRNFNYAILTPGDYVISMEFVAVNRRRLSSRFARSSGSE